MPNVTEEDKRRMIELFAPIEKQIMMTDDHKELLMLASQMLSATKDIFVHVLAPKGAITMFSETINNIKKEWELN